MNLLTQLSHISTSKAKPKPKPNPSSMRCVNLYKEAFGDDTLSPAEVAERLGYTPKSCYHSLKNLEDVGYVELVGSRRKFKVGATEFLYRWNEVGRWAVTQAGALVVVESPSGEIWNVYEDDADCAWHMAQAILKGELK